MTPNGFIFISLVLWIVSHCSYRKDSYNIFDKFYFNELFSLYQKQLFIKSCTIQDGPNCYQISSSEQYSQSSEVKEALDYFGNRIEIDTLSDFMSNVVQSFREEHRNALQVLPRISQAVSMNLLLTFESYDEATRKGDIYMPEEKVIKFKVGFFKLSFIGKLRLRNLNEKNPNDKKALEPQLTFGIIESKELIIKSDKPMTFNYVYIRPQKGIKLNKKITIVGYSNDDKEVYRVSETIANGRKWTKVIGRETVTIDYLKFAGDIEIDNLSVTELDESDDAFKNNNLQKIIEKAINDFVRKNRNDNSENEGIQIIHIDDL